MIAMVFVGLYALAAASAALGIAYELGRFVGKHGLAVAVVDLADEF